MLWWMLRGGQLAWCCTTGEYGRGSYLSVPEEEFNEDFFFWIWKTWIFRRKWKFWFFFFLKNLEILNFFKELKILIGFFFFFFWKIKKYWSFEGIWKFLLKICSLEIFPLEYGFGDFSSEKWRIFLLKMEIFFFFFEKPIL